MAAAAAEAARRENNREMFAASSSLSLSAGLIRDSPAGSDSGIDNLGLEMYEAMDPAAELPITVISADPSLGMRTMSVASIDQPVYLLQGSAGQLIAVPTGGPSYSEVSSKLFTQKPRFKFPGVVGSERKDSQAELILNATDFRIKGPGDSDLESASSSEADSVRVKKINKCMRSLGIGVIVIFIVVLMIIIITVIMKQSNQASEER